MDDYKIVNQLKRMKDQRALEEVTEFHIKDKDRPNFKKKDLFEEMYCTKDYLLQQSKIFYLYDEYPLSEGILDMEQLSKTKSTFIHKGEASDVPKLFRYASGPFFYEGSNEFVIVYQ